MTLWFAHGDQGASSKIFEIATEALTFAKSWDLGASSTSNMTLLLSLQLTCVSAMPEGQTQRPLKAFFLICSVVFLSATTTKDFRLRLICAYDNTIAIVLRPMCRNFTGAALVLRFQTASV